MMTTLIEIDSAFDTIEDRLMADLNKAKERARLLGEIPHTVSLTTYFNNEIIGVDARQMSTEGITDDEPTTLSDDPDLKALINGVVDARLIRPGAMMYFQPDPDRLATWGSLTDMRHYLEQWTVNSHVHPLGRAIQDIDRQCAELRQQVKDLRWGMWGLFFGLVMTMLFGGIIR